MEPVQPQGGRHGKRTYRYRRGAGNARRHLGGKRTRLVDAAVCLRQDRRRLRNGKYQSWNICARTRICTRSVSSTAKKTATSCR